MAAPAKVTRNELRQNASRHRYHYAPPPTPPGFWDMGFMDTQVCAHGPSLGVGQRWQVFGLLLELPAPTLCLQTML